MGRTPTVWTDSDIAELKRLSQDKTLTVDEIAVKLGRSRSSTYAKRAQLGLQRDFRAYGSTTRWFFTAEEDNIIKQDYLNYVPVEDTAAKLGRSWGSIRQRILHLGLTRDVKMFHLIQSYGRDVLQLGSDAASIRQALAKQLDELHASYKAEEEAKINILLRKATADIRDGTKTRVQAFLWLRAERLTLETIGAHFGLTRERVRQLTDPDYKLKLHGRNPRKYFYDLTCEICGAPFRARSKLARSCGACKPHVKRGINAAFRQQHPNYQRNYYHTKVKKG